MSPSGLDDDDFLDELPPLDGGLGEDDELDPADAALEEASHLDEEGGLDDATLGGDPGAELVVGGVESGWLEDAADADALEVGESIATFREAEREKLTDEGDEIGTAEEEFALGGGDGGELDRGEEGFEVEEEHVHEADLPRLDADDEGEMDDAAVGDPLADFADEVRPAWEDRAWDRASPALPIAAMNTLALREDGGVVAGGKVLTCVDEGGTCHVLGAAGLVGVVVALACEANALFVAVEDGRTFLSADRGATFRATGTPPHGRMVVRASFHEGETWVVTSGGRLAILRSSENVDTWAEPLRGVPVVALAEDAGVPVALSSGGAGLQLVRPARAAFVRSDLPPLPARAKPTPGCAFACAHGTIAVGIDGIGAFRLRAGTSVWERIGGSTDVTALAIVDASGTVLLAVHDAEDARSFLLRAPPPEGGEVRIVAEVGEQDASSDGGGTHGSAARLRAAASTDASGRAHALTWSDAQGTLWMAGSFGLVALKPS